jgi:hypothetical protein
MVSQKPVENSLSLEMEWCLVSRGPRMFTAQPHINQFNWIKEKATSQKTGESKPESKLFNELESTTCSVQALLNCVSFQRMDDVHDRFHRGDHGEHEEYHGISPGCAREYAPGYPLACDVKDV